MCHLDLNILARFARVRLVHASVEGIDLQKKRVILAGDRPPLSYDVLSINIGSAPKVQEDAGEAGVTPVKPIDGFGARWDALLRTVPSWRGDERRLLVVGGGAGGFELAMSIKARLTKESWRRLRAVQWSTWRWSAAPRCCLSTPRAPAPWRGRR
ncbi:unnamed protein product [Effrenium voratum]|nr:unnamed protein product [Effrenium voratum]